MEIKRARIFAGYWERKTLTEKAEATDKTLSLLQFSDSLDIFEDCIKLSTICSNFSSVVFRGHLERFGE